MNGKQVTMQTIAEACHVSIATVSRALHGSPGVGEDLAERIRSFAKAQGYTPNRTAQSLRMRRSNVVYIVSRIGKDGHSPLQIPSDERLESMLGVDVRVHPILMTDDLIDKLAWLEHNAMPRLYVIVGPCLVKDNSEFGSIRTPMLFVESDDAPTRYASVTSDDEHGAETMVESLIAAGHRRIAVLTVQQTGRISYKRRIDGYRAALKRHQISYDPSLVQPIPVETDDVFASAERFLNNHIVPVPSLQARPKPPTAIFVLSDFLALVLFRVATNIGIRIPDDLSVVSFGGWNVTRYLPVAIQSWAQPTADLIEASAKAMSCMLNEKPFPTTMALTGQHPDGSFGSAFSTSARHLIVRGYLRTGASVFSTEDT